MPLQSSGSISLNNVATEFGGSTPHAINEYYRAGTNVPDTTANASIPTSGTISLDDFYGGDSTPAASSVTPYFNWKYYAYGSTIGTINVYWRKNDGTLTLLRSVTGQQHTGTSQTWNSYSEDLSAHTGETGRIVYRYAAGSNFYNDPQLDAMEITETTGGTIDLEPDTVRGRTANQDTWIKYNYNNSSTFPSLSTGWTVVPTGSSTSNIWNYDSGGTPSGSTGNVRDSDNMLSQYYIYFEGSSPNYGSNKFGWLAMSKDYTLNGSSSGGGSGGSGGGSSYTAAIPTTGLYTHWDFSLLSANYSSGNYLNNTAISGTSGTNIGASSNTPALTAVSQGSGTNTIMVDSQNNLTCLRFTSTYSGTSDASRGEVYSDANAWVGLNSTTDRVGYIACYKISSGRVGWSNHILFATAQTGFVAGYLLYRNTSNSTIQPQVPSRNSVLTQSNAFMVSDMHFEMVQYTTSGYTIYHRRGTGGVTTWSGPWLQSGATVETYTDATWLTTYSTRLRLRMQDYWNGGPSVRYCEVAWYNNMSAYTSTQAASIFSDLATKWGSS